MNKIRWTKYNSLGVLIGLVIIPTGGLKSVCWFALGMITTYLYYEGKK